MGTVVAASATEELTALLQRLLNRTMETRLDTELKQFAELVKESQLKEVYGEESAVCWPKEGRTDP